jgi:hypothetical protein
MALADSLNISALKEGTFMAAKTAKLCSKLLLLLRQ